VLRLDSLPEKTLKVFECLAVNERLRDFTLIGGTALALQISHRKSEDLDFWLPAEKMDKETISAAVRRAQQAGFVAQLVTPHDKIVAAKINGRDLLAYAQDYVIGGVKVTFFARADTAFQHFNTYPRIASSAVSFGIMDLEGIFSMKSYVIHQRVRSRDLFDLKTFVQRGKTIEDILQAGSAADPACSSEYAKSVLLGDVPLDKEDEGFDSVDVTEKLQDIYSFFKCAINEYEQALAEQTFNVMLCSRCREAKCVCDARVPNMQDI
jgi:predicted nucleotidyltransferase component of viral defense system